MQAARSFYEGVFGFEVQVYSDRFWTFKAGNLSGGLDARLQGGSQGVGFSVTVPDMAQAIERIEIHGGSLIKPPYELAPGAGYCAQFRDPNGNVLELYCAVEA